MKNEENICQYCTRQRAITTLSLNVYLNKMYQECINDAVSTNQIVDILHFNDNVFKKLRKNYILMNSNGFI